MNNYFIILAAGSGKRFNSNKPKQYHLYKNKAIFKHSLEKAVNSKLFKKIILVLDNPDKFKKNKYHKKILIIKGGKERSDSSFIGIKYAKKLGIKNVFIHDAARPNFSIKLLKNLNKNLKKNNAVVPYVNSIDSVKYKFKKNYFFFLDQKENIFRQN